MSLTSPRFDDTLLHMSEQGNTLLYVLTPNLERSAKSVAVKRYSAQMKSTGTFCDAELQEESLMNLPVLPTVDEAIVWANELIAKITNLQTKDRRDASKVIDGLFERVPE